MCNLHLSNTEAVALFLLQWGADSSWPVQRCMDCSILTLFSCPNFPLRSSPPLTVLCIPSLPRLYLSSHFIFASRKKRAELLMREHMPKTVYQGPAFHQGQDNHFYHQVKMHMYQLFYSLAYITHRVCVTVTPCPRTYW